MKKLLSGIFIFILFLEAPLFSLEEKNNYVFYFAEHPVVLATPILEESGVLLVPAEALLARAGFELRWQAELNQLTATRRKDGLEVVFTAGSSRIKLASVARVAPVACRIYQSNFYLPVDFVAHLLNLDYQLESNKILVSPAGSGPVPVETGSVPESKKEVEKPAISPETKIISTRQLWAIQKVGPTDYQNLINQLNPQEKITLFVFGQKISGNLIFVEDQPLVAVRPFLATLEDSDLSQEGEVLEIHWEKYLLKFTLNSDMVEVGQERRRMPVEARKIKGEIYVPLASLVEYLELGLSYDSSTAQLWVAPQLLGLTLEEIEGRKVLRLSFSHQFFSYEAKLFEDPSRLVIDCPQSILALNAQEVKLTDSEIPRIKFAQFTRDTARVVVELLKNKTYFVAQQPQAKELLVMLVPWLEQLKVTPQAEGTDIRIKTSENISPRVFELHDPGRIILDFPGVAFKAQRALTVEGGPVVRVRGSQFKIWPLTTRLVVDLSGDASFDLKMFADEQLVVLSVVPLKKEPYLRKEKIKRYDILKNRLVVIDPGHGGDDPGAIAGGVYEKNLTLAVAQKISRFLNEAGATCLLALEEDSSMSLAERVSFVNSNNAEIFISLHYNSSYSKNMEGSETYYYKPRDYPLAEALHQALLEKLKRKDNFIRRAKFYVLTHTKVPAVLIEPVYLSNEKELKLSLDPEFQKQTALAVVDGLVNYFGKLKRKGKK